jgi:hypothetical protein
MRTHARMSEDNMHKLGMPTVMHIVFPVVFKCVPSYCPAIWEWAQQLVSWLWLHVAGFWLLLTEIVSNFNALVVKGFQICVQLHSRCSSTQPSNSAADVWYQQAISHLPSSLLYVKTEQRSWCRDCFPRMWRETGYAIETSLLWIFIASDALSLLTVVLLYRAFHNFFRDYKHL